MRHEPDPAFHPTDGETPTQSDQITGATTQSSPASENAFNDYEYTANGLPLPQPDMQAWAERMIDVLKGTETSFAGPSALASISTAEGDGFRLRMPERLQRAAVFQVLVTGSRDLSHPEPRVENPIAALQLLGTLLSATATTVKLEVSVATARTRQATATAIGLQASEISKREREKAEWLDRHVAGVARIARGGRISAHLEAYHKQGAPTLLCDFRTDTGDSWEVEVEAIAEPTLERLTAQVMDEFEAFHLLAELLARIRVATWLHY